MKFLFTADPHFSSYSQDKIDPKTNLPEKLSGIYLSFIEMINYGIKNKINTMVIGGDTFHNKSLIHSIAQSLVLDIVRQFSKDMYFIFLSGNHDMSNMTGTGVSATKCLDNEKNVTTIHQTQIIENILFVPWNPKVMNKDIKEGSADFLISHLGLNEGKLNSGISIVSDIGLKDLGKYKHCYFGHYHKAQSVGNATYVGSPIQLDWGEKNEEKRFLVIDSINGTSESILTSGYKKFFEFNISEENKEELTKTIYNLKEDGHSVKVNRTDDVEIPEIEKDFQVLDKREKDITNRGLDSSMSESDKLNRYLEIKGIPENQRDRYRNVALEIMGEF